MSLIRESINETITFWKPRWLHLAFLFLIWFTALFAGREDAEGNMWAYLIASTLGGIAIFCYLAFMIGKKDDSSS